MKKKYIAFIVLFCICLTLMLAGIGNLKNRKTNDGNSVTVDDLAEDAKEEDDGIAGEDVDSWIEPSTDNNAAKQDSSTDGKEEGESLENDSGKVEEDKPEWIGGDF